MLRIRLAICFVALVSIIGKPTLHAEAIRRVAIVPAVADFEQSNSEWRRALSGFDARVQAELLRGWQVEVLSRAGLSAVVFEQRLRAATDPKTPLHRVLPADLLALSVFDFTKKELRLHAVPVRPGMKVGNPTLLKVASPRALEDALPAEVARVLAKVGGFSERKADAAKENAGAGNAGLKLTCALLEPVSPEGLLDSATLGLAPLIRAGIEQAVASGDSGSIQLVERGEMARLLDEKAIKAVSLDGFDANAASQLGRMVKADLILVPFVHVADKTRSDVELFAQEVSTGRLLDCLSLRVTNGEPIPTGQVSAFLHRASTTARQSAGAAITDNAEARYAEAAFLADMPRQWLGLRMRQATINQGATRMADAALALCADEPDKMITTVAPLLSQCTPAYLHPREAEYLPNAEWIQEVAKLKKSGQFEILRAEARRVLELPLSQMAKTGSDFGILFAAMFWNNLGEHRKALDVLTAARKVPMVSGVPSIFHQEAARAYFGLERYSECAEVVLNEGRFGRFAMKLVADAFRATKEEAREFRILWFNRTRLDNEYDRQARAIDLAVKAGQTSEALEFLGDGSMDWARAEPIVQLAAIRARLAAGQKEFAISDTQCALLATRRNKSRFAGEFEKILQGLDAKPLDSLPPASDYIRLPPDVVIHLMHDETIKPDHARAIAGHLAAFWGCSVQIWPVKFEAEKLSCYNRLAQSFSVARMHDIVSEARLPQQKFVGRILLTNRKLASVVGQNSYVDFYSWNRPQLQIVSDHYFVKYASSDRRPLPLIDTIASASLPSVYHAIWRRLKSDDDVAKSFAPFPPDVFSNNGNLTMTRHDLGVSPRTGAELKKLTWDQITAEIERPDEHERKPLSPGDRAFVQDLTRQLEGMKPETVLPPKR